ncbi:DMT family transporter [Azospirillum soli]|uniref:DMT family transporter n=1 Tax=Azospirillum soli TaxID=1304799 RepID=UPI001AEA5C85|nr:DMT family transporter [Azospirillum soli]MBP2316943.1 drug/metabolite transporter (DMT)-like permease [Azospirillum soli]
MSLRRYLPSNGLAYGLLILAALFWGANLVAVRFAVGNVSPMALGCLRWVVVLLILAPFAARRCIGAAPALRAHWRPIVWIGGFGLTVPNLLIFVAAQSTTALNMAIFLGATPAFVFLGALLWHRTPSSPLQVVGMLATLLGVAVAAVRGDVARIADFGIHPGDLYVLLSGITGAAYQLYLRNTPPLPPLVLFYAMAAVAFIVSLPAAAVEALLGFGIWPTGIGWAVVTYVGLFPTLLSSFCMMRGIQLIGPSRGSLFVNLTPVFASLFAVLLLNEVVEPFHVVAVMLVLGGIVLSELKARSGAAG